MKKLRVLVIDDEPEALRYLSANLRARGYQALAAEDGRAGLKLAAESLVDLVLLDLMMPGIDGFAVCQALRRQSSVPIIVVSARGQQKDVVQALDLGADDYLTKPYGIAELLARMRAVLRRTAQTAAMPRPPISVGDLTVDFAAQQALIGGRPLRLTRTEYDLLAHLAANAGRVITHRALLQAVWGPEYGDESEYLWAYIRRLRHKIEADPCNPRYILTQPGVGYHLASCE